MTLCCLQVSIWDVDYTAANSSSSNNGAGSSSSSSDYDGVSMFAPHSDYVSAMKWVGGGSSGSATQLLSASYDGSVRLLDTQKGERPRGACAVRIISQVSTAPGCCLSPYRMHVFVHMSGGSGTSM
jgi:WD40 repeat protein